jgi:hypothetical protein
MRGAADHRSAGEKLVRAVTTASGAIVRPREADECPSVIEASAREELTEGAKRRHRPPFINPATP